MPTARSAPILAHVAATAARSAGIARRRPVHAAAAPHANGEIVGSEAALGSQAVTEGLDPSKSSPSNTIAPAATAAIQRPRALNRDRANDPRPSPT